MDCSWLWSIPGCSQAPTLGNSPRCEPTAPGLEIHGKQPGNPKAWPGVGNDSPLALSPEYISTSLAACEGRGSHRHADHGPPSTAGAAPGAAGWTWESLGKTPRGRSNPQVPQGLCTMHFSSFTFPPHPAAIQAPGEGPQPAGLSEVPATPPGTVMTTASLSNPNPPCCRETWPCCRADICQGSTA